MARKKSGAKKQASRGAVATTVGSRVVGRNSVREHDSVGGGAGQEVSGSLGLGVQHEAGIYNVESGAFDRRQTSCVVGGPLAHESMIVRGQRRGDKDADCSGTNPPSYLPEPLESSGQGTLTDGHDSKTRDHSVPTGEQTQEEAGASLTAAKKKRKRRKKKKNAASQSESAHVESGAEPTSGSAQRVAQDEASHDAASPRTFGALHVDTLCPVDEGTATISVKSPILGRTADLTLIKGAPSLAAGAVDGVEPQSWWRGAEGDGRSGTTGAASVGESDTAEGSASPVPDNEVSKSPGPGTEGPEGDCHESEKTGALGDVKAESSTQRDVHQSRRDTLDADGAVAVGLPEALEAGLDSTPGEAASVGDCAEHVPGPSYLGCSGGGEVSGEAVEGAGAESSTQRELEDGHDRKGAGAYAGARLTSVFRDSLVHYQKASCGGLPGATSPARDAADMKEVVGRGRDPQDVYAADPADEAREPNCFEPGGCWLSGVLEGGCVVS